MTDKETRDAAAAIGRERARRFHLSPAGYVGILEEWIVPIREGENWQETMVWKLDERDVGIFLDSLSSPTGGKEQQ